MKKIKVFLLSSVFLGTGINAQNKLKVSIDAGYTYSVLHANLSNLIESKYSPRYGIGINLMGEYIVWRGLFISTGVSFLQKNYEFKRTGSYDGWYTEYTNNFLSFPLLIGGYILNDPHKNKGVWIKLAGGMYTDYWLSMKRKGQYPIFAELQPDDNFKYEKTEDSYDFKKNENQLSRMGYGLQGQAQLGYSLKKIDIYVVYNYQYGLSDINKSEIAINKDEKMATRSYMLSVGISYKFD